MKFKLLLFTLLGLIISLTVNSQVEKYLLPQDFVSGSVRLKVSDLVGDDGLYKFKLTIINNSGTDYCVYDINKTGFEMAGIAAVYPVARNNKLVIGPNSKKSTVIKVKGVNPTVKQFKLHLDGLFSGTPKLLMNPFTEMIVSKGNMANERTGEAGVRVSEVKHLKKDLYRYSIQTEISFNEHTNNGVNLLIFDRDQVEVKDGDNLLQMKFLPLKKGALKEGGSKRFRFETETKGSSSMSINWNKALKKISMANIPVSDYEISKGKVE
jgi:hypothetical protein